MSSTLGDGMIHYPESDGRLLWESDWHHEAIGYLLLAVKWHFNDDADVYVSGTLLMYYIEGAPSAVVCPDVFVVKGVPKSRRRTYRLWEEGQPPALVIEVTSASTRYEDLVEKKEKYAKLGVEEYFLFDPLDEYLSPQLQGFRLAGERYWPIELEEDGSLRSRVTGLRLQVEGGQRLRLVDLATGKPLPRTRRKQRLAGRPKRRYGQRKCEWRQPRRRLPDCGASWRREPRPGKEIDIARARGPDRPARVSGSASDFYMTQPMGRSTKSLILLCQTASLPVSSS